MMGQPLNGVATYLHVIVEQQYKVKGRVAHPPIA
jgi:hypothetical protein